MTGGAPAADGVPTWDMAEVFPDEETFAEVADQLQHPGTILANAMLRVHQADAVRADITVLDAEAAADGTDGTDDTGRRMNLLDQCSYYLDSGHLLARIAEAAAALGRDGDNRAALDALDSLDALGGARTMSAEEAKVFTPQPANGVRFTVRLDGVYMGRVGDRLWLYAPAAGFVPFDGAESLTVGLHTQVTVTGRIVSATPTEMLGITDGGTGVSLPRALVTETPDE